MATQAERLAVVETKVANIDEKVGELKVDVKDLHDCLDRTRDLLDEKLDRMLDEYRSNRDSFYDHANKLHKQESAEHAELAGKIEDLEKFKNKWVYMITGGALLLGWMSSHTDTAIKFLKTLA